MEKLDLSKIDKWDLIDELKSRGFYTDFLYSIDDVDMQTDYINEERADDKKITLSEEQKLEVLDNSFNHGWYCEQMNVDLQTQILKYE